MAAVQSFILDFWPVLVLVLLRPVLGLVTATTFAAVRASVDRRLPHDLPRNTGDWLREQLRKRGVTGEIEVLTSTADHGAVDAFFPGSAFIQLSAETWLRRDPVGWATGAHELGHALNYRTSQALHALLVCARWSSRATWYVATTFVLANLLFGNVGVAQVTYGLLIIANVMNALVLWDELWASQVGMRMLREDGRLDGHRLDGAYLTMGAAFLSYASGMVASLAVLLVFPRVAQHVVAHEVYTPAGPLAGMDYWLVVGLSLALGIRAAFELWRMVRPPRYSSSAEAEVAIHLRSLIDTGWAVPLIALLALLWNQPAGTLFVIAFMLAALPGLQAVLRLLSPALPLVMLPLFLLLMPLIAMIVPSTPDPDVERRNDQPAGEEILDQVRAEMERGHEELRAAQLRLVNEPPMYMRLGGLVRVAYVPLLIVYWLLS